MRPIRQIVVHCSATRPSLDIGAAEIDAWHRQRGFDEIGYHAVIRRDGTIEQGRKHSSPGAHAKGYNSDTIGVCLVGGLDGTGAPAPIYEPVQLSSLWQWIGEQRRIYGALDVIGHRDLPGVAKACPSFDVVTWLRTGRLTGAVI